MTGPAALSFYVCPSLKPSSRPRLYDDYRYAIPYNRYAADQFVMVHKNNTFRKKIWRFIRRKNGFVKTIFYPRAVIRLSLHDQAGIPEARWVRFLPGTPRRDRPWMIYATGDLTGHRLY